VPQGNTWLLKIFTPGRRPTDEYLQAVDRCLPGALAFFTCTQRRLLTRQHLDLRASSYQNPSLADALDGAILMPKVPGTPWASMADDLRAGVLDLSLAQRLKLALTLAQAIDLLEAGACSHRDLSCSNVFVTPDGKVYLIDWDCLYHPSLPFQANTTLGTLGYMAPFRHATGGGGDAAWSWRPQADRFALAVLVAEILLIGPDTPEVHEDGTLFSQAQIDEPGNASVRHVIGRLTGVSRPGGSLLRRAFSSPTFEGCPAPGDWIAALRHAWKRTGANDASDRPINAPSRSIEVRCAECETPFSMARAKREELTDKGKAILCNACLGRRFAKSSAARAQRKAALPDVSCESCHRTFSISRPKLDDFRRRGRPILCPACLGPQLEKWRAEQAEYERAHPHVLCARCGGGFRLKQERLEELTAKGKTLLCPTCWRTKHEGGTGITTTQPANETGVGRKPCWHFIRRIFHGHSI
jgi:DNA-directed RNA polymerase subunit RPC12/RpoP